MKHIQPSDVVIALTKKHMEIIAAAIASATSELIPHGWCLCVTAETDEPGVHAFDLRKVNKINHS